MATPGRGVGVSATQTIWAEAKEGQIPQGENGAINQSGEGMDARR